MVERKQNKKKKRRIKKSVKMNLANSLILMSLLYLGKTRYTNMNQVQEDITLFKNNMSNTKEDMLELYSYLEEKVGEEIKSYDSISVLNAAYENENLSEEEKSIIYRFMDLLEENPYLDKKEAYKSLKNLDIIYLNNKDYSTNIVGFYDPKTDVITIIKDDENHETLIHELIHCITANKYNHNLPEYLIEGTTELLTNEYFMENPYVEQDSYPYEVLMTKILCQIVGSDKVLNTYSTGNMDIILNELANYTDKEKAKNYLSDLELLFKDFEEDGQLKYNFAFNRVFNYSNSLIVAKYGVYSEEFEKYKYYRELLNGMMDENPINYFKDYLDKKGYYEEPYFSKKLMEEASFELVPINSQTSYESQEKVYGIQKEFKHIV